MCVIYSHMAAKIKWRQEFKLLTCSATKYLGKMWFSILRLWSLFLSLLTFLFHLWVHSTGVYFDHRWSKRKKKCHSRQQSVATDICQFNLFDNFMYSYKISAIVSPPSRGPNDVGDWEANLIREARDSHFQFPISSPVEWLGRQCRFHN